tara:strand:+ start:965 stop:1246 length:282 start_codon:yes stop_codon:yes gene_type:complete
MTNQLNKFWSFQDTTNYRHIKKAYMLGKSDVVRTFYFKKSFLLEVSIMGDMHYVIPIKYISRNFPNGHYSGFSRSSRQNVITFSDSDIRKVLN